MPYNIHHHSEIGNSKMIAVHCTLEWAGSQRKCLPRLSPMAQAPCLPHHWPALDSPIQSHVVANTKQSDGGCKIALLQRGMAIISP
jgi:hypothetical protein